MRRLVKIALLRLSAVALLPVVLTVLPWKFGPGYGFESARAYGFAQSPILTKFVDVLPSIPIAVQAPVNPYPGSDYYEIGIQEFFQKMHTEMPATKLRGYVDLSASPVNPVSLGPIILAHKGTPVRIKFINTLPAGNFFLPLDTSLMGGNLPQNAVAVHLHGGFTPWISDGTPFQWFTPDGQTGPSFQPVPDMGTLNAGEATVYYTNDQSARLLWYHDHFVAMTRVNPYAGLAAGYLITDNEEQTLIGNNTLPGYGIPLIIQDKTFVNADPAKGALTVNQDPTWNDPANHPEWGQTTGSLWYPHIYETNQNVATGAPDPTGRWDYGKWVYPPVRNLAGALPNPSAVAEFFADTPILNGMAYPYREVLPQVYRFRILNGSNARNYNLQLYYEDPSNNGEPVLPTNPITPLATAPPTFLQIGNEGGFLPASAELNTNPPAQWDGVHWNLWLAPAERADILIDFSGIPDGARLILYSDMAAPAPSGDPRNDYFTGDPDFSSTGLGMGGAPTTLVGKGPNTRTLMEFRVNSATTNGDTPFATSLATIKTTLADPTAGLPGIFARSQPAPIVPLGTTVTNRDTTVGGIRNTIKTLNEDFDDYGRLIQKLGTDQLHVDNQNVYIAGFSYDQRATETAVKGTTQVWTVVNNTGDVHPIHFHLFNVQVVARTDWAGNNIPLDANEQGWKETVKMFPGQNTTVAMKFDLPTVPFSLPMSIRPLNGAMPFDATMNPMFNFGHEYVWHCHILEHEEHDMMRPMSVYQASLSGLMPTLLLNDSGSGSGK